MNRQVKRSIFRLLNKTINNSPMLFYHQLVIFRGENINHLLYNYAFYNNRFKELVVLTVCVDGF